MPGAFALSFSMLIAGYFGMNIRSGLEEENLAFVGIAVTGLVGSFAIYVLCRRVLTRSATRQHRHKFEFSFSFSQAQILNGSHL